MMRFEMHQSQDKSNETFKQPVSETKLKEKKNNILPDF